MVAYPAREDKAPRLCGHRARPRTTSSARSSCSDVLESIWPMMLRTRSCRSAIILSVIICERRRSPFEGLASIMGLSNSSSWTSDESGQTNTVDKSLVNSSACTITPGRGRPSSLGTTTSTTLAALHFQPLQSYAASFQESMASFSGCRTIALPAGANRPVPWDPADPEPNAARDASLVRATARGARPCAAAGYAAFALFGAAMPRRDM